MQTRYLSSNSGPGDSRPGNSSVFTKYVGNRCRPVISLAFTAILISSAQAHDHGGGGGGQSHQHGSGGHYYYRDPFRGSWYPGYSGVYDSDYWYVPTPEQRAEAQKQVQAYLAAVKKGRKHRTSHRYVAVKTLRPTKKQLQDYDNKRAAARLAAAKGVAVLYKCSVHLGKSQSYSIIDSQSKQFFVSCCYVVASMPPPGATAKFETFTAEYVGI